MYQNSTITKVKVVVLEEIVAMTLFLKIMQ